MTASSLKFIKMSPKCNYILMLPIFKGVNNFKTLLLIIKILQSNKFFDFLTINNLAFFHLRLVFIDCLVLTKFFLKYHE